ncbi:Tyrosine-protein phosphatase [Taphrina deformans PYCC 5710]|uniref:Tyrosine-protein phosphatase n=1 Tax=Taphrina deformans (strain PYCC 5710 / ATCC 11124 / CBS 356.35 / IMI 108563 / JCM 9778 / NBRC 8474) TaxID=1097556 RepID=R4X6F7_TAPDE|nr:Tyrosine-protein phosphatase [Taphrina deformans PYCC 5710]|eukprot:CCG80679.1 Tyrosine-protein phosphatase [Taphrina deformans PYCC 5710]
MQRLEAATGHISPYSFTSALQRNNVKKNRYRDILPFDANRVRLPLPNDYINASIVDSGTRRWIATQGPLDDTVNDFWELIYEHSSTIVMLCGFTEDRRPKCAAYFPTEVDQSLKGRDTARNIAWTVRCVSKSVDEESGAVIREFALERRRDSLPTQIKLIQHIHYETWPDHEATTIDQLRALIHRTIQIHDRTATSTTPMVVHCSAGCGRTGTFIALQALEEMPDQDVPDLVDKLRKQRIASVQSLAQFDLLCDFAKTLKAG